MESVVIAQASAGTLYLLIILIVGSRLVLLARRTRQLPELLLGGALLLGGVLGGPLEAAAGPVQREAGAIGGKLLLLGKIAGLGALICHATFIRRVFRPHERWPWLIVGIMVGFPSAAIIGYGSHGAFATSVIPMNWFWLEFAARITGAIWLTVEGAIYYGMMKRRLRLGLAEPLITNRFLLWTMAGVFSALVLFTAVPPMLLDPLTDANLLALDVFVFSFAGIGVSVLYFLTFLPPQGFRRWVGRTSEVVN